MQESFCWNVSFFSFVAFEFFFGALSDLEIPDSLSDLEIIDSRALSDLEILSSRALSRRWLNELE